MNTHQQKNIPGQLAPGTSDVGERHHLSVNINQTVSLSSRIECRCEPTLSFGFDVYIGQNGHVCISQRPPYEPETILILTVKETWKLLNHLSAALSQVQAEGSGT